MCTNRISMAECVYRANLMRYQARSIFGEADARLSTSARLATNQHDKEYGKEEVVVVLERVRLGIRAAG